MKWIIRTLLTCGLFVASHGLQKQAPEVLGRVCAFGDFNADRNTDILVFRNGTLTVNYQETKLLDVLEAPKFTPGTSFVVGPSDMDEILVECSVGDFNGDSHLDVLVSIRSSSKPTVDAVYNHTLWTMVDGVTKEFRPFPVASLAQHAMAIDVTNDGRTDVLGFYPNGSLFCTEFSSSGTIRPATDYCNHVFNAFPDSIRIFPGMPHMFVDLNSDLRADIIFMTKADDGSLVMNVWQMSKVNWQYREWIPRLAHPQFPYVAAPVTMDYDSDGEMDVLVPVCREADCEHITQLAVWSHTRQWSTVALDMQDFTVKRDPFSMVVFRVGDFSMDSYPDMLAIVQSPKASQMATAKVIENAECKSCEKNGTRRFDLKKMEFIQPKNLSLGSAKMATFFDLLEDGSLDLLVEYVYNNTTRFGFIYCPDKGDTTFLKVQVFTGLCSHPCNPVSDESGSSVSFAGACASFSMTDGWGGSTHSIACQVPASSNRALYLPFLLYGLGRSPNFVDELTIGIPKYADRKEDWKHSLKQIVPNSRIIVLPPSDEVGHWTSRLYVTPSALIVQSLIVIASVCCMLLMVVVFLHYREKKEDRFERQQQSHRFHFDAM